MTTTHLIGILYLCLAVAAYACARLTKADRNYYPMQRVIWTALSFLGVGAGLGALLGGTNTPISRAIFAVVLLIATLYSVFFMRRRNRTPRFLSLTLGGHPLAVDQDHLRTQVSNVVSLARHGAMPAEWVAEIEDAAKEWHRMDAWKNETLPAQMRGRRFRRGV